MPTDLLTIPQIAKALGVHRSRVDQWVARGDLVVEWHGPIRMATPEAVAQLQRSRKPPGRPKRPT